MKSLVLVTSLLALFSSASFAGDLSNNAKPLFSYEGVDILDLVGTKVDVRYIPATPKSVAYFKGNLGLKLEVEGNLCLSNPNTYGVLTDRVAHGTTLRLIAGSRLPIPENMACLSYSRRVISYVTQEIDLPVIPNEGGAKTNYFMDIARDKRVRLYLFQQGETLQLKVIPLPPLQRK